MDLLFSVLFYIMKSKKSQVRKTGSNWQSLIAILAHIKDLSEDISQLITIDKKCQVNNKVLTHELTEESLLTI